MQSIKEQDHEWQVFILNTQNMIFLIQTQAKQGLDPACDTIELQY